MNGLTAANVDGLVDAIKKTHANCLALEKREAARALADVLFVIHRLREENTTQASRPDRVGDECWYSNWNNESRYVWRRGILRAWLAGDDFAIIEDCETGRVQYKSEISFSTEAPK
jgi:hypothetical protein